LTNVHGRQPAWLHVGRTARRSLLVEQGIEVVGFPLHTCSFDGKNSIFPIICAILISIIQLRTFHAEHIISTCIVCSRVSLQLKIRSAPRTTVVLVQGVVQAKVASTREQAKSKSHYSSLKPYSDSAQCTLNVTLKPGFH
jgi:hypothetical protein